MYLAPLGMTTFVLFVIFSPDFIFVISMINKLILSAIAVTLTSGAMAAEPYTFKKYVPRLEVSNSPGTGGESPQTPVGNLDVSTPSLSFLKGSNGTTDTLQFLIQNNSTVAVNLNSINSPVGFAASSSCGAPSVLQPGQTCTVSVSIVRSYTTQTGTLSIVYNTNKTKTVSLSVPASDLPASLTLSSTSAVVPAGSGTGTQSTTLVVGNSNATAVSVSSMSITGGFTATSSCGTTPYSVPANGSCTITLSGVSTTSTAKSGTLTLTTSLSQSLTATVTQDKADANDGQIIFSDTSYVFEQGNYNETGSVNLAISNQGPGSATITNISATGGLTTTYNCSGKTLPAKLAAGEQCVISASSVHQYTQRTGIVTVTYGSGATATAQVIDPAAVATGTLVLDKTAVTLPVSNGATDESTVITLTNSSATNAYLKSIQMTDAANTFTQSNTCGTLPTVLSAGQTCTITVTGKASLVSADAVINVTYNTASALQATVTKPGAQITFKTVQGAGFKFATSDTKLNLADNRTVCGYIINGESGWTLPTGPVWGSAVTAIGGPALSAAGIPTSATSFYWTNDEYTQSQGPEATYRVATVYSNWSISYISNKNYISCVKSYSNLDVTANTNTTFNTFAGGPVDSRKFTVKAQGQTNIGNIVASVSGSGYTISANTCQGVTLAPNATCSITVDYASGGDATGQLLVNSNASNPEVAISLSGATTPLVYKSAKYQGYAIATSMTKLNYAASVMACANTIDGSNAWTLGSETNVYNALNTVGGTRMQAAGMPVNSTYFGAGNSAPIDWYWSSTDASQGGKRVRAVGGEGSYSADLNTTWYQGCTRIYSSGAITADTSATFSASIYGSTDSKVFTLTAYGTTLTGISAALESTGTPYSITGNTCGTSLAAGSTCKITVTFTPTVASTVTNKLVITSSSEDAINIALSGTGTGTSYGSSVQFLGHMDAWDATNTKLIDEAGKTVFTKTNSPAIVPGLFGNSLYIPKNTSSTVYSYLSSNAVALGAGQYTIEFWVKVEDPSNTTASNYYCPSVCTSEIMGSLVTGGNGWFIRAVTPASGNGGKGYIQFYSGYNSPPVVNTPASSLTFGQWTHVVVQRDNLNDTYVYLNGVRSGPTRIATTYGSIPIVLGGSGTQLISGTPAAKMVGYLDEVKVTVGVARYSGTTITVTTAPYSLN